MSKGLPETEHHITIEDLITDFAVKTDTASNKSDNSFNFMNIVNDDNKRAEIKEKIKANKQKKSLETKKSKN